MSACIFDPLSEGHPLITDGEHCPFCRRAFQPADRTTLLSVAPASALPSNVRGVVAHAGCAYKGARMARGEIADIQGGTGIDKPVVTTDGQRFSIDEFFD